VALHELPPGRRLHGHFSRDLEPVLEIDPGDSFEFATPNARWFDAAGAAVPRPDPELDVGHALAGPVLVRGVRAGQTLVVEFEEVRPASWGTTWTPSGHSVRWELADGAGRSRLGAVTLAPFLGVTGMPPAEPGVHPTRPPRRSGGNIDCKELVAGTTLYLPIPVDGALFSAGDGHAAQGDGELSGTAIECPVRARVRLDVRDDLPLEWPLARTADSWITFGFDEQLGRAAEIATDGMLELLGNQHGLSRDDALLLASVVVDVRVTQVVNESVGVHAVLRDDALR
jgi:acetamidase/formamidase